MNSMVQALGAAGGSAPSKAQPSSRCVPYGYHLRRGCGPGCRPATVLGGWRLCVGLVMVYSASVACRTTPFSPTRTTTSWCATPSVLVMGFVTALIAFQVPLHPGKIGPGCSWVRCCCWILVLVLHRRGQGQRCAALDRWADELPAIGAGQVRLSCCMPPTTWCARWR